MSRPKRVKKTVPPPEPPRDPRLVAIAEQAQRAGWTAEWCDADAGYLQTWVQLCHDDIKVSVFTGVGGGLNCYSQYSGYSAQPSRTPAEALRAAYAALGVALDQAEDAFGGTS